MAAQSDVVRLLMEHRTKIYAYIFSVLRDHYKAEEVLQNVSVVICDRADKFKMGTNFTAWAIEISRRKIAEYIRLNHKAVRFIEPSDMEQIALAFTEGVDSGYEERLSALRECLANSSDRLRMLIQLRYEERLSLGQIADRLGRKVDSVRKALYRGRVSLRGCIEKRLLNLNRNLDQHHA